MTEEVSNQELIEMGLVSPYENVEIINAQDYIDTIADLDIPKGIQYIFDDPPTLVAKNTLTGEAVKISPKKTEVKPASEEDMSIAKKETPVPSFIPVVWQGRMARQIQGLQVLVAAPTLVIEVEDHWHRREWRDAIKKIFTEVDKKHGRDPDETDSYTNSLEIFLKSDRSRTGSWQKPQFFLNMLALSIGDDNKANDHPFVAKALTEYKQEVDTLVMSREPSQDTSALMVQNITEIAKQILSDLQKI